ncbi:MAG: hypothetical protein KIT73_00630 [Burkholderiales bacterium]|nr:hypothetical protein [Burkholderiales bacterium]
MNGPPPPAARAIWQGFHWAFFIDVQGLILCLGRFQEALQLDLVDSAARELRTAAVLLRASGAAMQLAGSFSREAYQDDVRVSRTPPGVQSSSFSGLMSWEHSRLMRLWQQLSPQLAQLPDALQPDHEAFVQAFFSMLSAHREVCEKFGGGDGGSLRSGRDCAVDILDRFGRSRWETIDPQQRYGGGCPFAK